MIVTAVGGLTETIGERGTGIVAEEVTPEAIRREIESYFSNGAIRKYCVEHIREEKKRLSWAKFAEDLTNFAGSLNRTKL